MAWYNIFGKNKIRIAIGDVDDSGKLVDNSRATVPSASSWAKLRAVFRFKSAEVEGNVSASGRVLAGDPAPSESGVRRMYNRAAKAFRLYGHEDAAKKADDKAREYGVAMKTEDPAWTEKSIVIPAPAMNNANDDSVQKTKPLEPVTKGLIDELRTQFMGMVDGYNSGTKAHVADCNRDSLEYIAFDSAQLGGKDVAGLRELSDCYASIARKDTYRKNAYKLGNCLEDQLLGKEGRKAMLTLSALASARAEYIESGFAGTFKDYVSSVFAEPKDNGDRGANIYRAADDCAFVTRFGTMHQSILDYVFQELPKSSGQYEPVRSPNGLRAVDLNSKTNRQLGNIVNQSGVDIMDIQEGKKKKGESSGVLTSAGDRADEELS